MGDLPGPLQHTEVVLILSGNGSIIGDRPSSPLHCDAKYCSTMHCGALWRRNKRGKECFWVSGRCGRRGVAAPQNPSFSGLCRKLLLKASKCAIKHHALKHQDLLKKYPRAKTIAMNEKKFSALIQIYLIPPFRTFINRNNFVILPINVVIPEAIHMKHEEVCPKKPNVGFKDGGDDVERVGGRSMSGAPSYLRTLRVVVSALALQLKQPSYYSAHTKYNSKLPQIRSAR